MNRLGPGSNGSTFPRQNLMSRWDGSVSTFIVLYLAHRKSRMFADPSFVKSFFLNDYGWICAHTEPITIFTTLVLRIGGR